MKNASLIIQNLRAEGQRITPVRAAMIKILSKSAEPLTPQEILSALLRKKIRANKTTIYRQLEALKYSKIIYEVRLTDRTKRYELFSPGNHHHHLVCNVCKKIEDVSFPADLKTQEKIILKKNKFKVTDHSLEFFGTCLTCQN